MGINFNLEPTPKIIFKRGAFNQLSDLIAQHGNRALLITGAKSFTSTLNYSHLLEDLKKQAIQYFHYPIHNEPSVENIDQIVQDCFDKQVKVVVGIGGGSPIDAVKAIAGLLPGGASIMNYLEGVGAGLDYQDIPLPLIAVPTTAGTGSEATHNSVISRLGAQGFKKSFRHPRLTPAIALVDPELHLGCPPHITAACGMDAYTQLLESYLSTQANPFTDALALSGIEAVRNGLFAAMEDQIEGRTEMAYGALLSGLTLAHTGLGPVHGIAPILGNQFGIPHGVACGTLLASICQTNVRVITERDPLNPALSKLGRILRPQNPQLSDDLTAANTLVEQLWDWTERLAIPRLSAYGVKQEDIIPLAKKSSIRNNPVTLDHKELAASLMQRL